MDNDSQQQAHTQILSPSQFKMLITTIQYISHILFPSEYGHVQQKQPQSIMRKPTKIQFQVQNETYFKLQIQYSEQNNIKTMQTAQLNNQDKQYLQKLSQIQNYLHYQIQNQKDTEMIQQNQKQQCFKIKVKAYLQRIIERIYNFQRICIQLFYFLFACMRRNINIAFDQDLFVYSKNNSRFMVAIKEFAQAKIKNTNLTNRKSYFNLYISILNQLINTLQYNLFFLVSVLRKRKPQILIQSKVKKTVQEILAMQIKCQDVKNILQSFKILLNDARLVDVANHQDLLCFTQLQKCEFMATKSNFYRIRNRSINIYLYKQANMEIRQKLITAIKNQKTYIQKYNNIKSLLYSNKSQLKDISIKIYTNFEKYVQESWISGKNPVYVKIVQHSQQNKNIANCSSKISQDVPVFKILYKTKFKSIYQKFNYRQNSNKKEQILQFTTQIMIFQKTNNFCISLHTPLILQPSTCDQIIQNWNSLIYQSVHNISLEIGQKPEMFSKKKKYMIIKAMCQTRIGQSLIWTCFKLMDLAMVGYVILRSWDANIAANSHNKYDKLQQAIKQLNHYSGLITDLSNKLYLSV